MWAERSSVAERRIGAGGRLRYTALDTCARAPFVALAANTGSLYLFALELQHFNRNDSNNPATTTSETTTGTDATTTTTTATPQPADALRFLQIVSLKDLREPVVLMCSAPQPVPSSSGVVSASASSALGSSGGVGGAAAAAVSSLSSSSSSHVISGAGPGGSLGSSAGLAASSAGNVAAFGPGGGVGGGVGGGAAFPPVQPYLSAVVTSPKNRLFLLELSVSRDVHSGRLKASSVANNAFRVLACVQHDCAITSLLWLEALLPSAPQGLGGAGGGALDPNGKFTLFFGDERGRVFVVEDVVRFRSAAQAARLAASAKLKSSSFVSTEAEQVCLAGAPAETAAEGGSASDPASGGSPVVQMSQSGPHLLVSSHHGALVVDLAQWDATRRQVAQEQKASGGGSRAASQQVWQQQHKFITRVGSKPRDAPLGACFAPPGVTLDSASDGGVGGGPAILSARPAKRMWLADPKTGAVVQTFNFSNLSKVPARQLIAPSKFESKKVARKVQFAQVFPVTSNLLLCVNGARQQTAADPGDFEESGVGAVVVIDAKLVAVKEWATDMVGIADLRLFAPAVALPVNSVAGYIGLSPEPFNAVWVVAVADNRHAAAPARQNTVEVAATSKNVARPLALASQDNETVASVATNGVEDGGSTSAPSAPVSSPQGVVQITHPVLDASPSTESATEKHVQPLDDGELAIAQDGKPAEDIGLSEEPETAAVVVGTDESSSGTQSPPTTTGAVQAAVANDATPVGKTPAFDIPDPPALGPVEASSALFTQPVGDTLSSEGVGDTKVPLARVIASRQAGVHSATPSPVVPRPDDDNRIDDSDRALHASVRERSNSGANPPRRRRRRKQAQNVVDIAGPSSRPITTKKDREAAASPVPELSPGQGEGGTEASRTRLDFLEQAGLSVEVSHTTVGPSEPTSSEDVNASASSAEVEVVTVVTANPGTGLVPAGEESTSADATKPKKGVYTLLIEEQERARSEALQRAQEAERLEKEQTLEHKVEKAKEKMRIKTESSRVIAESLMSQITAKSKSAFSEIVQDIAQDFASEFADEGVSASFDLSEVGGTLTAPPVNQDMSLPTDDAATSETDEETQDDKQKLSKEAALRVLTRRTHWLHQAVLCFEQNAATPESVIDAVSLGSAGADKLDLTHWVNLLEFTLASNEIAVGNNDNDESGPIDGPSSSEVSAVLGDIASTVCDCLTSFAECVAIAHIRHDGDKVAGGISSAQEFGEFCRRWSNWLKAERLLRRLLSFLYPTQGVTELLDRDTAAQARANLTSQMLTPLLDVSVDSALARDNNLAAKLGAADGETSLQPREAIEALGSTRSLSLVLATVPRILSSGGDDPTADSVRLLCEYFGREWLPSATGELPPGCVVQLMDRSLVFGDGVDRAPAKPDQDMYRSIADAYLGPALKDHISSMAAGLSRFGASLGSWYVSIYLKHCDGNISGPSPLLTYLIEHSDAFKLPRDDVVALVEKLRLSGAPEMSQIAFDLLVETLERATSKSGLAPEWERALTFCLPPETSTAAQETQAVCSCFSFVSNALRVARVARFAADSAGRHKDTSGVTAASFLGRYFREVERIHGERCSSSTGIVPLLFPAEAEADLIEMLSVHELFALARAHPRMLCVSLEDEGVRAGAQLLRRALGRCIGEVQQQAALAALLEDVDSYSWKDKPTVTAPSAVAPTRAEVADCARQSVAAAVARLQEQQLAGPKRASARAPTPDALATLARQLAAPLDKAGAGAGGAGSGAASRSRSRGAQQHHVRVFTDKQIHWGAAGTLGGDHAACPLCTLLLRENVGNVSSVCVFPCGHAYHQHCFTTSESNSGARGGTGGASSSGGGTGSTVSGGGGAGDSSRSFVTIADGRAVPSLVPPHPAESITVCPMCVS